MFHLVINYVTKNTNININSNSDTRSQAQVMNDLLRSFFSVHRLARAECENFHIFGQNTKEIQWTFSLDRFVLLQKTRRRCAKKFDDSFVDSESDPRFSGN